MVAAVHVVAGAALLSVVLALLIVVLAAWFTFWALSHFVQPPGPGIIAAIVAVVLLLVFFA
jgi:hypothetical protein